MKLYEIEQAIAALVNEDGEIADIEQFEALALAREQKIEGVGCWVKNLEAEAKAIREEEKALADRRRANENKADRLRGYLSYFLHGEKYTSPRVSIGYRKSEAVELTVPDEQFIDWAQVARPELLKTTISVDKTAIRDALKRGEKFDFAYMFERRNMQIK